MQRSIVACLTGLALAWQAAAAPPVAGWRTDGTGRYPGAEPPLRWSATENVVWKTKMPAPGNATPVVVADRIFVCAEPTTLVCVRASDGKILWERTNTYLDALSPEEAAKARKLIEEVDLEGTTKQMQSVRGQLSRAEGEAKKAPDDASIKRRVEELKKQVQDLKARLAPVDKFVMPDAHAVNGYSSCTPTSDGKYVYVLFGTGMAACYDLDGNRQWMTMIAKPRDAYGHSASPVLVGGKLVTLVVQMVALDARTGQVAWQRAAGTRWGTPVATRIGDVDAVVTPNGEIYRVSDGALLAGRLSKLDFCAPIIDRGVVYFIQHGGKAIRLPPQPADKLAVESLWETKPRQERYYASPVLHDGLIYCVMQHGYMSAIDAGTGQVVYERKLDLGKGTYYPSVTAAGNRLFVSCDNGVTAVLEPGREYKEVARNTLEPFRSCPVFAGKRMYVRGLQHLYCIGQ